LVAVVASAMMARAMRSSLTHFSSTSVLSSTLTVWAARRVGHRETRAAVASNGTYGLP
jgi:hypothetical protein